MGEGSLRSLHLEAAVIPGLELVTVLAALLQDSRRPIRTKQRQLSAMVQHRLDQHRQRAQMVAEAKALVARRFPGTPTHMTCLHHALAIISVAKAHGVRLVLQAGTAYWQRMEPWQDDGVSPTDFGYEWEWSVMTQHRIAAGMLPELHAWAADPATHELVDITAGYFPAQCRMLIGKDWPGMEPPEWFWGSQLELPAQAIYRPNREATLVAAEFARAAFGPARRG